MLQVLDTTNKSIVVSPSSDIQWTIAWSDVNATSSIESSSSGNSNPTIDVVLASGQSGVRRIVRSITIHNSNPSLQRSFTLLLRNVSSDSIIAKGVLNPGSTWYSTDPMTLFDNVSYPIVPGDKGDIIVNENGTWTIDTDAVTTTKIIDKAVTLPKLADMTSDRLLGRDSASTGGVEQITVGGGIEFTSTGGIQTTALTGDVTKTAGGTSTTIANDAVTYAKMQNVTAASRLLGRGSASGSGDVQEITLGTGLSMSGTTVNSAVGSFKNLVINGNMAIAKRSEKGSGNWISFTTPLALSTVATFTDTSFQVPANSEILEVEVRITAAVTGVGAGAKLQVGISGTPALFGEITDILSRVGGVNTGATFVFKSLTRFTSAQNIRFTFADGAGGDNTPTAGSVFVIVRYWNNDTITTSGYHSADRWYTILSSQGTWRQEILRDAPAGSGFSNSLRMIVTAADNTVGASDRALIQQRFQGENLVRMLKGTSNARSVTVSFWVKTNVTTGDFIVELEDVRNSRFYSQKYTPANTDWNRYTLTFTGETSNALLDDNSHQLSLNFWLAAGTNFTSGTLQSGWHGTTANRAVGQVNAAATNSNSWQLTGVQMELGDSASDFEFLPIGIQQELCRYYYTQIGPGLKGAQVFTPVFGAAIVNSTNAFQMGTPLSTEMRVTPAAIFTTTASDYRVSDYSTTNTINSFKILTQRPADNTMPLGISVISTTIYGSFDITGLANGFFSTGPADVGPIGLIHLRADKQAAFIGLDAEL